MALVPPGDPRDAAWFAAGVEAAQRLSGRAAAVVVGRDPVATAWVALGLAQAIAPTRRVAIADLIGLPAPFARLLTGDRHDGIAEAFLDGVPLTEIAHPIDGLPNGFLLPAGGAAVQRDTIVGSDRWRRLATGFAEVGALLLPCVVSGTPGLDDLVAHAGGAVCVGTDVLLDPTATTIATLVIERPPERPPERPAQRTPRASPRVPAQPPAQLPPQPAAPPLAPATGRATPRTLETASASGTLGAVLPRRPTADFKAVLDDAMRAPPSASGVPSARADDPRKGRSAGPSGSALPPSWESAPPPLWRAWTVALLLFATMAATGVALATWRREIRAGLDSGWRRAAALAGRRAPGPATDGPGPVEDEAAQRLASAPAAVPEAPVVAWTVTNAADSLVAAQWAIEVVAVNTEVGAQARLAEASPPLPAGTWAPTTLAGSASLWYRVFAGAAPTRSAADSLLARLRAAGALAPDGGRLVRVPFAVRLAQGVPPDSATAYVARFRGAGLPAYALRHADGREDVLCGAFETPQHAALLAPALRAARVAPTLVYRTGRPSQ